MGSLYVKRNRIYLSFKDASGEWRGRSSGLPSGEEKRAQKMLDKLEQRIAAGTRFSGKASVSVKEYSARWLKDREYRGIASVKDDGTRLRLHVWPVIGSMRMSNVRPRHARDLVRHMAQKRTKQGELYANGTVREVYFLAHQFFADAVIDGVVDANLFVVKKHELPKPCDKDPNWRSTAVFSSGELLQLISDQRIPEDRRVLFALMGLGGLRFGEAAARRWGDYDPAVAPLGKLTINSAYNTKTRKEKSTKTKAPRAIPVHPRLASMLNAWKRKSWETYFCQSPGIDDLIVPSVKNTFRSVNHALRQFHNDLDRLGLRRRRQHDLRRTFISLARAGGARPDVLKWATHGSSRAIIDTYTTFPWKALCEAVSALKLDSRELTDSDQYTNHA